MNRTSRCPGAGNPETAREFALRMRQLKAWSGLTLRQLERRARSIGEHLPRSTLAATLTHLRLPREPLLVAFVKACDCSSADIENWVDARRRVAMKISTITDR
ncbi:helix-turn-helix domain-containing protein [Sphaerisporangium fuscum]|uniref:helix-turn-helix domain-containing protein n=1 Tax=Sphaerisporangium fuscum TaxID=2835868 RepID=UPI0035570CAC